MGELEEIKELLKATLHSINQNMQMQQQMILQLQEDNRYMRQELHHKSLQKPIPTQNKSNPLQTEVMQKLKRNKKKLIKSKILDTIKVQEISIPEIKEIIVDQHNYCSKATFYRYIEELKDHDYIHISSRNTVKIKPLVEAI